MAQTPQYAHLISFFDVPADARNPRLLISDVDLVTRLLVDHENSPLQRENLSGTKPKRIHYGADLQ